MNDMIAFDVGLERTMHLTTMAHLKTVADPHYYCDVSNFELFAGVAWILEAHRSRRDPRVGHLHGSSVASITCSDVSQEGGEGCWWLDVEFLGVVGGFVTRNPHQGSSLTVLWFFPRVRPTDDYLDC
jgi:hypothetical protein